MTGRLKPADNFLAVEVNNTRTPDAIPAMAFDWWNYGGITRDVSLVSVPEAFVEDYFIRLDKDSADRISADVRLSGAPAGTSVLVEIPELKVRETASADERGAAALSFRVKNLKRWSPEDPKLYRVIVSAGRDRVEEMIGFRNVRVEGEDIYLNGAPVFLKSVSFHEEIPQRMGRAFSESDAVMLLSEARALGCNMIRLAHYPQNEYIVRLAEKMGFMLWEEIPVWQGIDFANDATRQKAGRMIREMVGRDRNRCALTFWGVANETQPSESRNEFLRYLISCCRELDDTRLIVAAFDLVRFDRDRRLFVIDDPFIEALDVVAVNKYIGCVPSVARHARSGCRAGRCAGETAHHLRIRRRGPLRTARRGRYGQFVERRVSGGPLPGQPPPCSSTFPTCGACRRGFSSISVRRSGSIPRISEGLEPQGAGFGPGIPQESVVSDESLLR